MRGRRQKTSGRSAFKFAFARGVAPDLRYTDRCSTVSSTTDVGLKAEDGSCSEGKATRRLGARRDGTRRDGPQSSRPYGLRPRLAVASSRSIQYSIIHVGGPRLRMRLEHHTSTTHSTNTTRAPGHILRRCGRAGVRRKTKSRNEGEGLALILILQHGPVLLFGGSVHPGPDSSLTLRIRIRLWSGVNPTSGESQYVEPLQELRAQHDDWLGVGVERRGPGVGVTLPSAALAQTSTSGGRAYGRQAGSFLPVLTSDHAQRT